MTPQELRTSIFQMAFQGKLVDQLPQEGTADELFSVIKTEYLSKKIADPQIDNEDELPFEIPDTWKWVHFNHIATSNLGKTLDKVKNTGELCPYLCSINVYWDGISLEKVKEARFEEVEREKYILKKGDLLVCEGGDVGRSAIWNREETMYYQNALHRIRFFADIDPYFYKYLLECYKGMGIIDRHSKGVTIKHLVQNALYAIWIPLPPVTEQKRIVAKIEELLPLIDRYEQAWSRLEDFNKRFPVDMQKSILQMAIQGKLVPQLSEEGTGEELFQQIQAEKQALIKVGKIKKEKPLPEITEDEIPFDIPECWRWCRLSELAVLENGDRSSRYPVDADYVDVGMPFFGAKDMSGRYMSFDNVRYISKTKFEELGNGKLQDNDFVCLLRGTVGKISQFKKDRKHETGFICAQMVIVRSVSSTIVDYLYTVMTSPYYFRFIESKTTGTAVRQLPAKELGSILVPLPPLAEQERIVAKLEEILPLCERLK